MGGVLSVPSADSSAEKQRALAAMAAEAAAEEERKKEQERLRRGREGTIRTSYNGILNSDNSNNTEFKRKKLLGE